MGTHSGLKGLGTKKENAVFASFVSKRTLPLLRVPIFLACAVDVTLRIAILGHYVRKPYFMVVLTLRFANSALVFKLFGLMQLHFEIETRGRVDKRGLAK